MKYRRAECRNTECGWAMQVLLPQGAAPAAAFNAPDLELADLAESHLAFAKEHTIETHVVEIVTVHE